MSNLPAEFSFAFWQDYAIGRREGLFLRSKAGVVCWKRQLDKAMHFHWCATRKPQHVLVTELWKDKGAHELCRTHSVCRCAWAAACAGWDWGGNDLATSPSSHVTQLLDFTCGKASFWGYPRAVRRITLISAGAEDKVYWRTCSGSIKGGCFLLVGIFQGQPAKHFSS